MNIARRLIAVGAALVASLAAAGPLAAQEAGTSGTITGRVIDRTTQQPLVGVSVLVVGTQRGAQTQEDGTFRIAGVPAGTYQVRAQRIGLQAQTLPVTVQAGGSASVDFSLGAAAVQLEQVVINAVTGQAQRRSELGTNTGYVAVADLAKGPITKMSDVLQGRVAGVSLQGTSGAAGTSQRIRIRGANSLSLSNEPLLYIDGILASNSKGGFTLGGQDYSRLNDINYEEVENIEILKGPAASAIYGSAAANGVILITTKRGRAGAPRYQIYAETGTQKDENEYPLNYAALTRFGADTASVYSIEDGGVLRTRAVYGSTSGMPYDNCPNYLAGLAAGTTGACTQDTVLAFNQFRDPRTTPFQTGYRNKVGANVSGGGENLTYFLAGDLERENGVLRPNMVDRISLRTNLNAPIGKNATTAISAAYITSKTNRLSSDNSVFSPLINAFLGTAQYLPGMESDTVFEAGSRLGSYFGYNTADQRKVTADQDVDRFVIGANASYTPISWLRLNGNAGLDMFSRFDRSTIDPNNLPLSREYLLGWRNASRAANHLWTANGSASGTFNLASSLVSTSTVGGSYQRGLFRTTECYGVGIPAGTESCSATTSQFDVDEQYTDERTVGVFGRQEFAFADRLFLAGSVRADNNSGIISGLSVFPSANVSWVVTKEPFFPQTNAVSMLRLRAAYGQSGQRPGFGATETFYGSTASQGAGVELPALVLTNTGNTALKVERTTEIEGGFDAGFWGDRINAEYTLFNRSSKDALISRNLPPSAGLSASVWQNLGQVSNRGQEFALDVRALDVRNVQLNVRLTATTLRNRIDELGAKITPITLNRGAQAHRERFPAGAFFALPLKYDDANNDGKLALAEVSIDSARFLVVPDEVNGGTDTLSLAYMGPSMPTNTQNYSGELTLFRNITISTLFERRAGQKQLNYSEYFRCRTQFANPYYGQCSAIANPNATLAEQAAFIGAQFTGFGATPFGYIEDASFVKWRELSVRFNVPESVTRRFGSRGLAFSVAARNLKTWTKYTGLDPEINEGGGSSNFGQGEFNTQPPVRTLTFRVDFQP